MNENTFSILIVDDNKMNVKLLEKVLTKEGYVTLSAYNGKDAQDIACKENPDIILLDIKMPGEDGFSVIKFLKSRPDTSSIPVIFLTGLSDIKSKLTGFDLGAVDYILKPFHPKEVIARVRLHLKLSIATNALIADQAHKLKQITEAQISLLIKPSMYPEANFGIFYDSLHEAGGDFYDILPISKEIFGYFVADFSGHDIKTSYYTASIKALLKQNCSPVYQPNESIKIINEILIEILPENKYLTACYTKLNRKAKELIIINAGHPPIVYVPKNKDPYLIEIGGDIIGIFHNAFFEQETLNVAEGDRFYIYSDGLIESAEEQKVWTAGSTKLLEIIDNARDIPIKDTPDTIVKKMFENSEKPDDDIVLIGVEV